MEIDNTRGTVDDTDDNDGEQPLGERVIQVVESAPQRTIRPAGLSAALGGAISINEACAELCGLMAAVGGGPDGASFTFEAQSPSLTDSSSSKDSTPVSSPAPPPVMVFTFPKDFAARALTYRQTQERWRRIQEIGRVVIRVIKIVTAFGLILSLLILLIAAILGVTAVLIASQNDRGGRGRALVMRQLHSLFYTGRQLLWCWALFGPAGENEDDRDPFLRETAYDLALFCSLCCGNPGSIFFWWRAQQFSERRRRRLYRGWAGQGRDHSEGSPGAYGIEGVTLLRGGDRILPTSSSSSSEYRGLLSIAVEFLFGPTPFHPLGDNDKWKLRSAVIVQTCTTEGGITLRQLGPYADLPPSTVHDSAKIVQQGMAQVAFLNGIPKEANEVTAEALFVFPELLSESSTVLAYEPSPEDAYDGNVFSMLYASPQMEHNRRLARRPGLPLFWKEPYYHFTKLSSSQFLNCVFLGLLNALGVFWLAQSLQPNGALGPLVQGRLRTFLVGALLPVLSFYAQLFFALPAVRLLGVVYLNTARQRRNARRERLSKELRATTATTL